MPTLCIQQDKRKQQTVDYGEYRRRLRVEDINNTFMVIRRYYGKQCNALNFLLFLYIYNIYIYIPIRDTKVVLEKHGEASSDRVPFAQQILPSFRY